MKDQLIRLLFFFLSCPLFVSGQDSLCFSRLNDATINAFRELYRKDQQTNVLVSAQAFSVLLSLLPPEANNVSPFCTNEYFHYLISGSKSDSLFRYVSKNSYWYDQQISRNDALAKSASTVDLKAIDFSSEINAKNQIDRWLLANGGTTEKGPMHLESSTHPVFLNVNNFSAQWLQKFDPTRTTEGIFNNGLNSKVTYMETKGFFNAAGRFDYTQFFSLSLLDKRYSFIVFIPQSVEALVDILDEKMLMETVIHKSYYDKYRIFYSEVRIPKMSFTMEAGLADLIATLPDEHPLRKQSNAPKSGFISSTLSLTENGGAGMDKVKGPMHRDRNVFLIDRPFLFLIVDEQNKLILYLGTFVRP